MPPNDVVRHDLKVSEQSDWEGEPLPLPLVSAPERVAAPANPPATTMISKQINTAPYRSVGKMMIKFNPLRSMGVTGWVVSTRAFITAGHCVYSVKRGGWIIEADFCPRFNVECSARLYKVEAVFTLQGWLDQNQTGEPNQSQYDMAACLVTKLFQRSEPPLQFVVNSPATRYAAIGYPSKPIRAHEFNGKRMWQALGKRTYQNAVICAENNLTGGASGGPWCDPANKWVVSGLTSARVKEDPNLAASPVFSQGFQNLYDAVKDL